MSWLLSMCIGIKLSPWNMFCRGVYHFWAQTELENVFDAINCIHLICCVEVTYSVCDCCPWLRIVYVTAACGYARCTWLLPVVTYGARDCCLRLRMVHMTAVCSYVWCTWLLSSVTYSVCDCCLWSYWPFEVKALCHFTVPEPNQPQCSVTSQNTVLLCADL